MAIIISLIIIFGIGLFGLNCAKADEMFEYTVRWWGCNGAGEAEQGVEYQGKNREKAIAALRECKERYIDGTINVTVLGREDYYRRLREKEVEDYELLREEEAALWYEAGLEEQDWDGTWNPDAHVITDEELRGLLEDAIVTDKMMDWEIPECFNY